MSNQDRSKEQEQCSFAAIIHRQRVSLRVHKFVYEVHHVLANIDQIIRCQKFGNTPHSHPFGPTRPEGQVYGTLNNHASRVISGILFSI